MDQAGRAIFYDDQLRDAAVKHLAMKARWQTRKMAATGVVTIMFFDEPALAGLGSSAFITISHDEILACFAEVFEGVRSEGGLTGVHVCANTDWSVLLETTVDILNLDAYGYAEALALYREAQALFDELGIGRYAAWMEHRLQTVNAAIHAEMVAGQLLEGAGKRLEAGEGPGPDEVDLYEVSLGAIVDAYGRHDEAPSSGRARSGR